MNLFSTTLFALFLSTVLSSPTGSGGDGKGEGIAVTLEAVATTEDAGFDLEALQDVHGKDFEASIDTDLDLEGRSVGFDAMEEIDKRGTKFIISTVGTSLRSEMLKYHNAWRAHHSAPALKWNTTLAIAALKSARKCVFAHTKNNKFGENIAAGTYTNPAYYASLWYNEVSKYNFNKPGFSSETGHFTAVVWKNTKQIGCAYVKNCAGGLPNMLFCEYSPPGNVLPVANFRTNVLPARSSPKNPAQPSPNL
ncbi:hypothetical protein TWF506_005975 [Arthrobotrys conoides]|uniref:SCP domain-containing protein n=1 Tax=Arthrobotrys conoides TaxID=74498 RepID=A0AAN8RTK2_9PEZI